MLLCRKPSSLKNYEREANQNENADNNSSSFKCWTWFKMNIDEIKNHKKIRTKEQIEQKLAKAKRKIIKVFESRCLNQYLCVGEI